jgi:hypothetical protein
MNAAQPINVTQSYAEPSPRGCAKEGTAISSSSDEASHLEDDTRCRRTGVQVPFEAAGFLALRSRRDSPRDPPEGVPPTSESCRASLAGLAAREPSAAVTRWTRLALGRTPHRPRRPLRSGSMIETPASQNSFSTSMASKPGRARSCRPLSPKTALKRFGARSLAGRASKFALCPPPLGWMRDGHLRATGAPCSVPAGLLNKGPRGSRRNPRRPMSTRPAGREFYSWGALWRVSQPFIESSCASACSPPVSRRCPCSDRRGRRRQLRSCA